MSNDTVVLSSPALTDTSESARLAALRLAFGVTACFTVVEALNWDVTFLAPLLAASMLMKPRPPTFGQGLVLVILIAMSTGAVFVLTTMLISNPSVLILALALLLFLSFYAHRRAAPEPATLLLQISAVSLPVLAVLSPDGAGGFAVTLLLAGIVALFTVWLAHAAFPAPPPTSAGGASVTKPTPPMEPALAARSALSHTLVLIPILAWFILDATQVAVVVLIVIVTLLRQHTPDQGQRVAAGLILGNVSGGIAAAIVYSLVLLVNTVPFFFTALLASSLIFAGSIAKAGRRAPVYGVAFSTFILLLGSGLSPLPGGSGEAFIDRLFYVFLAATYAIGLLSLAQPSPNYKASYGGVR